MITDDIDQPRKPFRQRVDFMHRAGAEQGLLPSGGFQPMLDIGFGARFRHRLQTAARRNVRESPAVYLQDRRSIEVELPHQQDL